ncbi:MAG: type VI secretion system tip protein VgrG [Sandaracinaceae bacterium]|nr:type VI secretion system tip protein VgrG [Sandaracinaceae bacterium]
MADPTIHYHFETAAFPGETLVVRRVEIDEALDRPYRARVELAHHDIDADVGLYLGKDCVLEIQRADDVRRLVGIVRHVRESEDAHNAQQNVLVEIVPALHLLSLRRDTRIFQNETVPDILEAVLSEGLSPYGRSIDKSKLEETYEPREYCVQYQESDLDFVERLMQEEGISYTFTHEGEQEVMHLRDANGQMPELSSGALVPFASHNQHIVDIEPVHRFRLRHRSTITSVVTRDWDWTRAGDMTVEDEERGADPAGTDRESYEHGEGRSLTIGGYAGTAYGAEDSGRQKRIRREAHVRDAIVGYGSGSVIQFAPGTVFELAGHEVAGCDGRYLITSVQHLSTPPPDAATQATTPEPYHNRFECIPIATTHRPARRTPKPTIASIQTALVTGPSGEEIHVDEHGRIKVQFFWDRQNPADETSSCWVRCEQPWAGASWGFWYVPRIGMEVVVHFVDGDPDRPLVSGCVYDGANSLPYPLPDEKTKSTIKSNSSLGGGGFNEFRFEDLAGSEQIYTHAQKDYNEVVEHDHNTLVHNDQTNTVDVNQTQTIHQHQVEQVDIDQTMTVDGNRSVLVEGDYDETVDGTQTRKVTGDVEETFDATETRMVAASLTEKLMANETRDIAASQTETILGSHTLTISTDMTHEITGALTKTVVGGITQTTTGAYDVTATGGYTVVAPGGVKLTAAGGVSLSAPGGVTHVDSQKSWVGLWKYDGGANNFSWCSFKFDVIGMQLGVVGMKNEFAMIQTEVYAAKLHVTSGTALGTFATWLRNAGASVEVMPSSDV